MGKQFHIAFAADEKFATHFFIAASSVIKACRDTGDTPAIHFLDCGIKEETWQKVSCQLRETSLRWNVEMTVSRHIISMDLFSNYTIWNSSRATYARILLPSILSDVNHCVYADCDILFATSPSAIIDQLVSKKVMMVGHKNPDECSQKVDFKWFESAGLSYNANAYCCAGLIGINLDLFRKQRAEEQLFRFLNEHKDVITPDQSALNWLCKNSVALLAAGWGVFPHEAYDNTIKIHALHFSGGMPWKGLRDWYIWLMHHHYVEAWQRYARQATKGVFKLDLPTNTGRLSGTLAELLTRVILLLDFSPRPLKRYLHDARITIYGHKSIDEFTRCLLLR